MSVVKAKDLESALLRKGFRPDMTHHRYYWFFDGGKKTSVRTKISHGENEYDDTLLGMVKKQLGLKTKQQLLKLVDCPLSEEDYLSHLLKTGRIRR